MTRMSILAAPGIGWVINTQGLHNKMALLLYDRQQNGDSFPGEHVVRFPRRIRVNEFFFVNNGPYFRKKQKWQE